MKLKFLFIAAFAVSLALIFYLPSRSNHHVVEKKKSVAKAAVQSAYVADNGNPYIKKLINDYFAFVNDNLKKDVAPGAAVAIVRDTSIICLKGFGLRNSNTKDSIDINTVFRIGSVSKSFAAILTGKLVDENKLAFDDAVLKYLPKFRLKSEEQTSALKLRHLLSHTTGLPYHAFTDRVDDGADFDSLVYHLRDLDLLGKPGQLYSYQNVGYSIISDVIHVATGKTYGENLREKIFVPLHMNTASVSYDEIMRNTNVARPHRLIRNTWTPMAISSTYYNVAPAGGINASISDMGRWLKALTDTQGTFITASSKSAIFHPFVRATSRNHNFWRWKPLTSAWYGMGWRVLNFKDDTLVYHGGFVNGYRSEVAMNQKTKVAICVLVNSSGGLADTAIPKFFELYTLYRGQIEAWEDAHPKITK